MNICSGKFGGGRSSALHDEIVYDGDKHVSCPLCDAIKEIARLEAEIERLEKEQ